MKRLLMLLTISLLACLTLIGCGANQAPTTTTPSTNTSTTPEPAVASTTPAAGGQPLITVRFSGGLCQYGPCWGEKQINADGTYQTRDGTGAQQNGALDAASVAELAELVAAADFEQIQAQPFTGTCPLAYDGQEATYIFHTVQDEPTLASCTVGIDPNSPLFQRIDALVAEMDQAS